MVKYTFQISITPTEQVRARIKHAKKTSSLTIVKQTEQETQTQTGSTQTERHVFSSKGRPRWGRDMQSKEKLGPPKWVVLLDPTLFSQRFRYSNWKCEVIEEDPRCLKL